MPIPGKMYLLNAKFFEVTASERELGKLAPPLNKSGLTEGGNR